MRRSVASLLLVLGVLQTSHARPVSSDPSGAELGLRLEKMIKGVGIRGEARDLSYASVVDLGLKRNLALRNAELEVPIAEARYREAEAARNPTLYNEYFYVHQEPNLVRQDLPNIRYVLLASGYSLAQSTLYALGQNQMLDRTRLYIPVYTGGRLESNMHLQEALTRVARYDHERARQQLAFEAKRQYLLTLLARQTVEVADQVRTQARDIEALANSRMNTGVGTMLDVLQAQVASSSAEDALLKTQTSVQQAEADLAALLDLPVLTPFDYAEKLDSPELLANEPLQSGNLKELVDRALAQRPELSAMREKLQANQERQNIARSEGLPEFGLQFNYDVIGAPSRLGAAPSLIATLTIPIFDGGVSDAKVDELQVRRLQLETQELELIQRITLDVRKASLQVQEADSRLEAARVAEQRAREGLRVATLRYEVGAGTSLELVTAQTALANAQFALAEAHFRQLLSRATLNFALASPSLPAASPQDSGGKS